MRIKSQSKTKTGKLQLSVDEKKGAGHEEEQRCTNGLIEQKEAETGIK
jgi:hypothetical protein